ncbi:MAG TPA: hypothetical protein VH542_11380 [Steroidobacteraceae bacterium]|jgi:hypothetical protein
MQYPRSFVAHALLALMLLLGQIAAQTHAYAHLRVTGDPATPASQHTPCSECLSFAPLLSATHSSHGSANFQFEDVSTRVVVDSVSLTSRCSAHSFQSRAPPVLL